MGESGSNALSGDQSDQKRKTASVVPTDRDLLESILIVLLLKCFSG